MISNVARELILFPFRLFGFIVQGLIFPPKREEKETPELRVLNRRVKMLEATNIHLASMNDSLQHQLQEMARRSQRELEQQEKRWRKIVEDLKRQLSWERLKK